MCSKYKKIIQSAVVMIILFTLLQSSVLACTGIRLKGADGTIVTGRSMEWGLSNLHSKILIFPRKMEFTGLTPDGKEGLKWASLYGFVGVNANDKLNIIEGLNEKGLACQGFYFPDFAEYEHYDPKEANKTIAITDLPIYILTQFKDTDEVRKALEAIRVVLVADPDPKIAPPLMHFMVTDPGGKSLVIEYVNGKLNLYDNPIGVITNSPPFDWHITNLRNYINLSPFPFPATKINGVELAPIGSHSGFLGLPGDFTPPSRFIRAVAFSQTARPTTGGFDTVRELFRILDNFNIGADIKKGAENDTTPVDGIIADTEWTSVSDTKNLIFYYHTMYNRRLRMLNLKLLDFNVPDIITIPLDNSMDEDIQDITPKK